MQAPVISAPSVLEALHCCWPTLRYALDARHRAVPHHCLTAVCLSVAMTAYYAMFEEARLRPGHNVLVHSAAGGVGTMLCQMGKIIGCKVVGVVGRGHKVKYALAHGCDHVIDKSTQDLWALASEFAPEGYHAVFGTWRATWGVTKLLGSQAAVQMPTACRP